MIMKFAVLLGYTVAALGMSMPIKDALPVRAQTFASLDRGDDDPVPPHKAINDCSGPEPTKVIWTHDGHIDDLIAGIHLAKSPKYEIVGVVIGGTGEASSAHTGARNYLRVLEMLGLGHLADKHMVGVGPSIESFNEKFNQGEPADGGLECRFTDAWKEPGLHRDADLLGGVTNMLPFSEHSAYDLQKNVSDFEDAASAYEHGDPGGYDARAYAAHDYLSTSDEVFREIGRHHRAVNRHLHRPLQLQKDVPQIVCQADGSVLHGRLVRRGGGQHQVRHPSRQFGAERPQSQDLDD